MRGRQRKKEKEQKRSETESKEEFISFSDFDLQNRYATSKLKYFLKQKATSIQS